MRKSLGRVFLTLFIFLHVGLFASTYTWSATANKTSAYLHEAIHLKYVCSFSDASELYTIEFNPSGEYESFTLKNLSQSEHIVDGKRVNSYEFVAFAKEAGKIEFAFEAAMKKTTQESIENTVIGRDNVQKEDFTVTKEPLQALRVTIKETNSPFVGNFDLEIEKDEPEVKKFEPYHLHLTLKGVGNFEMLEPLDFALEGVKVFASKPRLSKKLHEDGSHGEWSQKFAFVAKKDFTIPKKSIEYFSLKEQKKKSLILEPIEVKIKGGYEKEELLDKEPPKKEFRFDYDYLYYILFFLAGFLSAKIKIDKKEPKGTLREEFSQKIDAAKSLDELMILLVLEDAKRYEKIISDIENKKLTSLASAKKMSSLI